MNDLTVPRLGSRQEVWGQSGYTPVDEHIPVFPTTASKSFEEVADEFRLDYQRKMLLGFTTHELENLGVVTTRSLRPGNLPNHIHPLFRREKWETNPPSDFAIKTLYPLPKPLSGDCL
jgi:hypothetical protein